ncbi:hypothetical protein B0J13DRAFT_555421 [Dactylonectria estremocensis]|uniref:Uncharacterized protein n=1 Tax=Dactylonectria estremocensis TaxID=1079267 RepID=A0A9P9ET90_9HYPO|nr:hypothetical protein B0J13DRAFT_555421 [Dactylonectria estremocensis]
MELSIGGVPLWLPYVLAELGNNAMHCVTIVNCVRFIYEIRTMGHLLGIKKSGIRSVRRAKSVSWTHGLISTLRCRRLVLALEGKKYLAEAQARIVSRTSELCQ